MQRGTLMKSQGPAPYPSTPLSYVNVENSVSTLLAETKTALPSGHVEEPSESGKGKTTFPGEIIPRTVPAGDRN